MGDALELDIGGRTLRFAIRPLAISAVRETNAFARKNNKSVRETLQHRRYAHLAEWTAQQYASQLDQPLGTFLLGLKQDEDPWYARFLNPYGDLEYCGFTVDDSALAHRKGVYLYVVNGDIRYVGRSRDPFRKRINQGYGRIHPKNCYLDGQATNCHLNSLLAEQAPGAVALGLCSLESDEEIVEVERRLIAKLRPGWNIQLAR